MGYLSERTHWSWNLKSETMPARQTVFLAYVMPWEGSWGASWRSCKETRWFSSKQGRGENGGDKTEAGNPESGPQKCWYGFGSVQYSSVAQSCPTLCDPMNSSMPGLPVHHQLPELAQTDVKSVMPVFHIRWPKYWSFSFDISPSNEYLGLISFWIGWLDHLSVQGTLKSLLQHTVRKHQFFGAQLSCIGSS